MTNANLLVPAAQYLRMSTEHQRYSLENQSSAIQKYAVTHGFQVVFTYSDAAKSGLVLKRRAGLRQLLQDVVAGTAPYRAILVYDISRWGRFQDTDESAHYEFLCKSAGVPVHYCAEIFANDGTLSSLIMKALKRTMAGEYSRELGVKVLAGLTRLARLGFKQGGAPGYGLRRMLVSGSGEPKHELRAGERKSIATDRVILVPGPEYEVQVVRDIFRMHVSERLTIRNIVISLNRRCVQYIGSSPWNYRAVHTLLSNPKYTGCHVFGRISCRLSTPVVKLPSSEWVFTPDAFQPIVSFDTFSRAQIILQNRTYHKSDEEALKSLRALLAANGSLSIALIQNSDGVPSPSSFRRRFGSLGRAYELIGYGQPGHVIANDLRRTRQLLRNDLMAQIVALFPDEVSIFRRGGKWRSRLRLKSGLMVSVLVSHAVDWRQSVAWRVNPAVRECGFVTLLARVNDGNESFLDLHILPSVDRAVTPDGPA